MDTMKLLLGATIAALLAAVVVSWNGMQLGVKNTSPDELERLKKQVAELKADKERQDLEDRIKRGTESLTVPVAPPPADSQKVEELERQMREAQTRADKLEEERIKAEKAERLAREEADTLSLPGRERQAEGAREARLIEQALLIAKVKEFISNADTGDFAVLDLVMLEQVQVGTILAIRRKTGILGQLKISSIEGSQAVANLLPGFGPIHPEPGDELILQPRF